MNRIGHYDLNSNGRIYCLACSMMVRCSAVLYHIKLCYVTRVACGVFNFVDF